MTVKAYISADQTATFICPQCQKPKILNVSKYLSRNTQIKLKVTCGCGHQYVALLEKRKKFRKQTNLNGIYKYTYQSPDGRHIEDIGKMTLTNLSFSGLRVKVFFPPRFSVGDKLTVEFKLDDVKKSFVRKEVIVKNIDGLTAGLEFIFNDPYDAILGFYLFNAGDG